MKKPIAQISRVERYMARYPSAKPKEIADVLDLPLKAVYNYRMLIKRKNIQLQAMDDIESYLNKVVPKTVKVKEFPVTMIEPDPVNHPAHYKVGGIETIDFIEAKGLNYNLGNVVKYITRSDHKNNREEDLKKARWYLDREIMKQHI